MAKPVVDGLRDELKGRAKTLGVDVGSDAGGPVAAKFGVSMVPTFVLLDGDGRVIYKKVGGRPEVETIRAALAKLGK